VHRKGGYHFVDIVLARDNLNPIYIIIIHEGKNCTH
jgi:hypothetical protein